MGNANWLTVKIGLDIIIPVTGNRPNAPVLFQREAQVFFCFLNLSMRYPNQILSVVSLFRPKGLKCQEKSIYLHSNTIYNHRKDRNLTELR